MKQQPYPDNIKRFTEKEQYSIPYHRVIGM